MTSDSVPFAFRRNNGGLNSNDSALALRDNESSELQNIDFDKFGSFAKRNGYITLNSTAISFGGDDTNALSLLHMDGTDASTSFPDAGETGHTWTANGDAQVDTAQSVFGGAAALFDGTGDYLTSADSSDWQLGGGTGSFTIDLQVRFADISSNRTFFSQFVDASNNWRFFWDQSTTELVFEVDDTGSTDVDIRNTWSPAINTWYHVALVRNSNSWLMFIDGTQIGTTATDTDAVNDLAAAADIGIQDGAGTPADGHNGWIDEFRLSNTARWTANFTKPNRPYNAETGGPTLVGMHWFEKSDGNNDLVVVAGTDILKSDEVDGIFDNITGTLTITAGDANLVSMRTFLDTTIATNNVDLPWKFDGTGNAATLTVPTGLTDAKFMEIFNSFTILANVTVSGTVHQSRVFWSTINTIETWNSADFNDVSRNDGQDIAGLKVLGEELIIFKDRSIWKAIFTGDADVPFLFFKTRSHVGAVSGFSIQEIDNGLFFRSEDGYYFFDGNNSFKVSDRITTTLEGFNKNRKSVTTSAYLKTKNRYYSSATTSGATQHNRVITWDSFNNAWSLYTGLNPSVFAIVNIAGEERIYFGDYVGFVYQADTTDNDNPSGTQTAIDAFYRTKWYDFTDIVNVKAIPHIYIYFQLNTATLTFAYSYDFENADSFTQTLNTGSGGSAYGSSEYGTATYGATGGSVTRRDLISRGRVVRFKFANATLDETFQIDGFGALPHVETAV